MLYNGMLILVLLAALTVGGVLGFMVKQRLSRKKLESCENLSARIIGEAKKEAENIKKEAILQAKENLLKVKTEFEKDTRDRKGELDALERRLRSKEENLERRTDLLSQKEIGIENREKAILHRESQLNEKHEHADRILEEQKIKLEQIAGINSEEA
ncbi:MAG: Rnase Y domain-containing protein, partial [Deltaproteobacteria bacterium]|nr:Rnase Y domain-containing protein [Deltaproteobacteria bacterium]